MKKFKRKKGLSFEQKKTAAGYIFIAPLLFGFFILFIPYIVDTLRFSVNDIVIGGSSYSLEWKGLDYYHEALFVNADFIQHVIKSLGTLLLQVPTVIVFSLFMASVLNQRFRGRVMVRAIFFLPVVLATGIVAKADMVYNLSSALFNRTELSSGGTLFDLSGFLYSLNFSEGMTKAVVSAANGIETVVNASGMQIFILLAAYQEIPQSYYEAAMIDGASKWEMFWKVTIPCVRNQIVIVAVYTMIDYFTQTDNEVFYYINNIGIRGSRYSLAMAMSVLYLIGIGIMIGIIMFTITRYFRKKGG